MRKVYKTVEWKRIKSIDEGNIKKRCVCDRTKPEIKKKVFYGVSVKYEKQKRHGNVCTGSYNRRQIWGVY